MLHFRFGLVAFVFLHLLGAGLVHASNWSFHPEENNFVSDAHSRQQASVAISDGASGVIAAWEDLRNELYYNIHAQRISANGDPLWTLDGVRLCTQNSNQVSARIASDGAGGAIVVWIDQRSDPQGDLYAQRIDATGNVLWNPAGVAIVTAASQQSDHRIISDGNGGAIVTWVDHRSGVDVYAQRIDTGGTAQWTPDGELVVGLAAAQFNPALATDGAGGAIIAWDDRRNDPILDEVFAQRVLANGTMAWTTNGVPVAVVPWIQRHPSVSYAVGQGAFIAWEDSRAAGTEFHIYIQRLLADGTPAFAVNGIQVSTLGGAADNFNPQVVDAASPFSVPGRGVYVVWDHRTGGGDQELLLQHVSYSGSIFGPETQLTFGLGDKLDFHAATNEVEGGVVISWTSDEFFGAGTSNIFVTKYNGSFEFSSGGVDVCTAIGVQSMSHVVPDQQGGVIVVWDDERGGVADSDVMAQRVDFSANLGYASADITSIVDNPQDQGKEVVVTWDRSRIDVAPTAIATQYSLWRRNQNAMSPAAFGAPVTSATALLAGVDLGLASSQAAAGWEFVTTVPTVHLPSYSVTAPTYGDSLGGSTPQTAFLVVLESDIGEWYSAPDSGYSVDNLAPLAPLELQGTTVGMDAQLDWNPPPQTPDVAAYNVYRDSAPGVVVDPGNLMATIPDLSYLDATTAGTPHYYVVTAVDDADLEGPPSNEVSAPLGSGGIPGTLPLVLSLAAAGGNPAQAPVRFRYGLPADTEVSIAVLDVMGRVVFREHLGQTPAGWHEYNFAGNDRFARNLNNGVYFFELRAGPLSRVLKFVLVS